MEASVRRRIFKVIVGGLVVGGALGAGVAIDLYPPWVGVSIAVVVAIIGALRVSRIRRGLPADEMADATGFKAPGQRIFDTVMGIVLLGVVGIGLVVNQPGAALAPVLMFLVVGGLGLECLISAVRDRRSLLSRIGALP
ncbi:hypothetical protein BH10PSE17_BH10PSE17_16590 [soil metagenome]